jgi:hypothetical protein
MATIGGRATTGPAGGVASGTSNSNVSQREDLANFISLITRDETPFLSSIGKSKATAIYHEWQTDELAAPGNSKLVDGADYVQPGAGGSEGGAAFNPVGPSRTRLGNYTQINGKTIAVSGTRRAVDQAGVADEYAYQLKKRGTELRRDIEHDLVNGYQVANGSGTRTMGGFQSYVNDEKTCTFASGTAVGANAGKGTHVPTLLADASRSALSLTDIDGTMQKIYEQGGKATKIMLSPKLRRDFSDLMVGDTGVQRNIDADGKLRQSVDIYMSDFGDLMVVPNYIMGLQTGTAGTANDYSDSCALVYDPQWFALASLRPLAEVDVGQKGDSTVGMLVEENTFEVKNPLGCGAIYGLK